MHPFSRLLSSWLAVIFGVASQSGATEGSDANHASRRNQSYVSTHAKSVEGPFIVVVEQGSAALAMRSSDFRLAVFGNRDEPIFNNTTLVIRGKAYFVDGKTVTAALCAGDSSLPAIVASEEVGDSFVEVVFGGKRLGRPLLIATRPKGAVAQIVSAVPAGDDSYLALGENYAMVDVEAYASKASHEGVASHMQGAPHAHSGKTRDEDSQASAPGVCIRSPMGPGWVEWEGVDPWSYGYSVKPEESNSLIYGHLPSDSCDGIYNLGWRCGVALKIPDHCTFYVGQWAYCCNAAMIQLYGVVRPVYPGSGGEASEWPYCPLP